MYHLIPMKTHEDKTASVMRMIGALGILNIAVPMKGAQILRGSCERTITPEQAAKILAEFSQNIRPIDGHEVNRLASAMSTGMWEDHGSVIRFDKQGILRDGQHRLSAVVKCGRAQTFVVVYGITDDKEVDTNKRRHTGTYLRHNGERNVTNLRAAIRLGSSYDRGKSLASCSAGGGDDYTVTEGLMWLELNPEMRESVRAASVQRNLRPVNSRFVAFLHFVATRAGLGAQADTFLQQLTGIDCPTGSAVAALRVRLMGSRKCEPAQQLALTIKAWNAFVVGRNLSRISWAPDETFPTINLLEQ